jgi:hypothetical protein
MTSKFRVAGLVLGVALLATAPPASAQGQGPFQYHSLTPCRIVDTRVAGTTVGTYGGVMTSNLEKVYPVQGNCGVPVGAKAVTVNVTACAPTNQGRLTVYPSGISTPLVSTINFPPGTTCLANGAIVPLSAGVTCSAFTPSTCDFAVMPFVVNNGQVHMILDVTGYFAELP